MGKCGEAKRARSVSFTFGLYMNHRESAQSVCVADCYFIVNALDLPFASPIAICH